MIKIAAVGGEIRAALLAWYDAHRRDLPWRAAAAETPDPYRVWLSEVMLQQTRVETVRPYYERWLERFPTLESLAEAPRDEVMKAWEGLGYYSRARNFHRAVREVAESYGGTVPSEPEAFRALPGVGRYTAGAVMSIAYGREAPLVDGNVRRVFARWMDAPDPRDAELWSLAGALVPGPRPGDLNQALMELGATVCTPRSPRCGACPVAQWCAARAAGTQEQRPARRVAKPLPHEDTAVAVVRHASRLLLVRRRPGVRLGGMWGFPGAVRRPDEAVGAAAARAVHEGVGLDVQTMDPLGVVEHTFTHVRVTYRAIWCEVQGGEPAALGYDAWVWAARDELDRYALPSAQKKLAALATETSLFSP
ncbi:MAG: A/G-specific adenine glycosylase [Gemmatimonadetes bacterium]|nr:A/G-specific adenine glycosylase [Gemmatimonadota bacterium]